MKGLFSVIVLAGALVLTGCTKEDNKELKMDHTEILATAKTSEVIASTDEKTAKPVESAKPKATLKPVQTKAPVTKVEKAVNKSKEANKAANSAIVDSILAKKEKKPVEKDSDASNLLEAITTMRTLTKDFKQKAESKDLEQVKGISEQLTQIWAKINVNIKGEFPEMHPLLDEKIAILAEKTNLEEVDFKEVIQVDYQLYQSFRQLFDQING